MISTLSTSARLFVMVARAAEQDAEDDMIEGTDTVPTAHFRKREIVTSTSQAAS